MTANRYSWSQSGMVRDDNGSFVLASDAAASEWRPIESAPKDGTNVILTNGKDVAEGNWVHDEGGTTEYRDSDGRWISQDDRDGFEGWIDWLGGMPDPTHWMPLPTAPSITVQKEQGK
jgi:hypothetical protein